MRVLLAGAMAFTLAALASGRGKHTDVAEILAQMDKMSKDLASLSANLEYTKVTVLVDDKSTQSGQLFFHKGKTTEIRINFQKPEPKTLLFKKNKGYMFLPKINQLQVFNLEQNSGLVQQFLLVGFGTNSGELKRTYVVTYLREENIDNDPNVVLELVPRKSNLAGQISKIQIWVSEESWRPTQQKFIESGGDYSIARYSGVKVNRDRDWPKSLFELDTPGAKVVKMN
jgi:outer membrane lipoprotein-sorting protein